MGERSTYFFDLPKKEVIYARHNGIIGIDTNPYGFALIYTKKK
ncbi:hypothetical protein CPAL_02660 [Clostridium thermopalmarium DSM 5974]|uniref:Uncharacterized protein n=2 Tax=Clostridium TaxID=1485 RepID=A0A151AKZ9_9CLOT|nr:hypothetical protein [Clostridium thermopalmarium]KYH28200.1 hypothetical protein CLCOL_21530 [Clostridium colicanis DSM 13634]PRR76595.1 hypothetical protein CPAL_02660 [Clostridium thermopalmarium DSM 5974]PVZ28292.1 hypothetical protein LX19_00263 [Clostridium thermopalmarium DSM 5974]